MAVKALIFLFVDEGFIKCYLIKQQQKRRECLLPINNKDFYGICKFYTILSILSDKKQWKKRE